MKLKVEKKWLKGIKMRLFFELVIEWEDRKKQWKVLREEVKM